MKLLLLALIFAISSLSSPMACAEEWKTSFGAEAEVEGLGWLGGDVGPDNLTYRGIYSAKLPTTIRYGRAFRFRALPYVQWDPKNVSKSERFYYDLPEGYFQWQNLPYTVQVGLNVFTWGDTDVFNPLDVVNPRRYFDPFRSEKIGTPAVVVKREFENFFVEGVYIPFQRKTRVPGENSRWLPRDVYRIRSFDLGSGSAPARIVLPDDLRYYYEPTGEVDQALRNNFAVRAKFRLSGFDWTLAAYQGASATPDVRPLNVTAETTSLANGEYTINVDPDVSLQATYYPVRMTGTSFTWELGDFLVKGAAAYTAVLNRRYDLPARLWENAVALERTFSVGKGSLTALLQATIVERGDQLDTNSVSLIRMFERAGMGALRWAPNEDLTVTASYLRDTRYGGGVFLSDISYKVRDGWRLRASTVIMNGPQETPIGTYAANDRATISLAASF